MHKKVDYMKYLLTVLCGFMLFASCNEDNEVTDDTESKENTVIVYVTGDKIGRAHV